MIGSMYSIVDIKDADFCDQMVKDIVSDLKYSKPEFAGTVDETIFMELVNFVSSFEFLMTYHLKKYLDENNIDDRTQYAQVFGSVTFATLRMGVLKQFFTIHRDELNLQDFGELGKDYVHNRLKEVFDIYESVKSSDNPEVEFCKSINSTYADAVAGHSTSYYKKFFSHDRENSLFEFTKCCYRLSMYYELTKMFQSCNYLDCYINWLRVYDDTPEKDTSSGIPIVGMSKHVDLISSTTANKLYAVAVNHDVECFRQKHDDTFFGRQFVDEMYGDIKKDIAWYFKRVNYYKFAAFVQFITSDMYNVMYRKPTMPQQVMPKYGQAMHFASHVRDSYDESIQMCFLVRYMHEFNILKLYETLIDNKIVNDMLDGDLRHNVTALLTIYDSIRGDDADFVDKEFCHRANVMFANMLDSFAQSVASCSLEPTYLIVPLRIFNAFVSKYKRCADLPEFVQFLREYAEDYDARLAKDAIAVSEISSLAWQVKDFEKFKE